MRLQELGNRIRAQREKRGLKQIDIAHALQISPQAVSKWERAENAPDIVIIGSLAKLLGVSTDWLLGMNEEDQDVFEATVLASTVIGAYKKSLGMKPRDFAGWANGFLFQLTEAVLRFDAVPIKYIGDGFLCFFSGADHEVRALKASFLAREMVAERLCIEISSGDIYLGSVGHPDYGRPDIMGEVVNVAFQTMGWAEAETDSMIAATGRTTRKLRGSVQAGQTASVNFRGVASPVEVQEIIPNESTPRSGEK